MNGSAQNAGPRKKRDHATLAVAPITRAIRAALAVSATALALSSPVVSLAADTGSYDATRNTYACDGAFSQTIRDTSLVPPVDLTVVPGDQSPASVNPATAFAGIDAVCAGDVSAIAYVGTSVDTSGIVDALDVGSVDDVTLVGGGNAFADAITTNAFSLSSDISIGSQADGTFEIDFAGVINADSFIDGVNDIVAKAVNSLAIDNGSDISVSGYGNVFGLDIFDGDSVSFNNSADISAEAGVGAGYWGTGAYATGVRVNSMDAALSNNGGISATAHADGYSAWARGVDSFGYSVGSTVHNAGDIEASAQADGGVARAFGVYSFGYAGSSNVDNAGDIHASAQADGGRAYATAINSVAYGYSGGLDTSIANSGTLSADADADLAYAITIFNIATGRYGNAYVTNADDGKIYAEATGDFTTATAVINQATRYGSAVTSNAGGIYATANGMSGGAAFGISNYSQGYAATVDNSGSVSATATSTSIDGLALATGIDNASEMYNANVYNTGSISVDADGGTLALALGVSSTAGLSSYVLNQAGGVIDAVASSQDGYAQAVGAYASGQQTVTLLNYGDISAQADSVNGSASAYAAFVNAGYAGIGLLINGGSLSADASAAAGGDATAVGGFVYADVATIFNDGSAVATAASVGGQAIATGLGTYGLYSAISNYGDLTASASADGGIAEATGAGSFGYNGSSFYNASDIVANASADEGVASATGVSSIGIFTAYATNNGTISAEATGGQTSATGLYNASAFDAITVNEGSISAVADGTLAAYGEYEALAFGVYNLAMYYDSVVVNNESISASASATTDISGTDGFLVAKALGAVALSMYGYGETVIANSGSITASAETSQGYAGAWGAVAMSGMYGSASIENENLISVYAHTDIGSADTVGAYVRTIAGTSSVVNHGDIVATADAERGIVNVSVNYADATGVEVFSIPYGAGAAIVDNYGNIQANARVLGGIGYATGVAAYGRDTTIHNALGASITATVEAELFGGAFATAVEAGGQYSFNLVNDGRIAAYAHANAFSEGENGFYGAAGATGIYVNASYKGDAVVTNNGDINAIAIAENSVSWAQGGAGTTGVHVYAKYDASIINAGDITAFSQAQFGNVAAYGAVVHSKYSGTIANEAGASIVASSSVGSLAGDQSAGRAFAVGTQIFGNGSEYAEIYNAGDIISHAVVTPDGTEAPIGSIALAFGSSIGYNSGLQQGTVTNLDSIEAAASADFGYASAYGAFVRTQYDSAITNTGDILASASAAGGNAFAIGTYAFSLHQTITYNCDAYGCDWANPIVELVGGESLLDNSGDIIASANAQGGVGYSYGAVALGAFAAGITNAGHISAVTNADDALAVGALANSFYGDALLQNSGVIGAVARGDIANANGVVVLGYNGAEVDNAGTIVAAAYGPEAIATALLMDSNGSNVLTNTGTIAAFGDGTRIAISSGSGATSIANSGSITGAILTGDLDDNLDNAAGSLWHAVGESDFGAGDDHIVNHGTILMDDAVIRLGGYVNGNTFDNSGTLAVSGAGNVLDMDNAFPFDNNGVITFVDGAADDVLTIVGDFAGEGTLNLDVSLLNQASDQLYVDGSVIEPTTQTLNVNLVDVLSAPSVDIPLVRVSGNAAADDFVLGNVSYGAGGFLTLDFDLNSSIDAAGADVFSLGVDVSGLNAAGSSAAAMAPGAHSLINAQVGTWRQRMGAVPTRGSDSGVAPWMRMFADSGDVGAQHRANFGAGGVFGFHQSNHGWELGMDTRPSEHIAFGALLGKSEGSQRLDAGAGSDRFDGRSFGLYGTWLGNSGFYLDVSQRWSEVEARLNTTTGIHPMKASVDTFNVEAGYTAWTLAGVNVTPQLQYTHSRIGDAVVHDGGSRFASEGGVSSRGRLGVAFDKSFQSSGFTLTPYGSLNVVREFDGDYDYSVNDGLLGTTRTEGTSAMVELGLGARKGGLSLTGGVNWTDGGAQQGVMGGQLAVRYGW